MNYKWETFYEDLHKYEEIKSYFYDFVEENKDTILNDKYFIDDIHHHCFNTDYYIIGTYQAKKWLGDQVLDIIQFIKEYEEDNFGEVNTDFSKESDASKKEKEIFQRNMKGFGEYLDNL